MPVDPFLIPFLPTPPLPDRDDYDVWRAEANAESDALTAQVAEEPPGNVESRTTSIAVSGGQTIELGIFRPVGGTALPVHIYFHGGGWVGGSALGRATTILAQERAIGADCVVVTVNYRKAPENPYPVALEDSYAAFVWVLSHSDELGIDTDRITIGGTSAGGNLAATLALKVRDERGPAILLQLLEVPALDLSLSQSSHKDQDLGSNYALHRSDVERMINAYLGPDGDPTDPYVSPLLADDVSGVAPAYIISAEFDLLKDDGRAYAEKLTAAGVRASYSLQPGHVHASSGFTKAMASARSWRDEAIDALRRAHAAAQ